MKIFYREINKGKYLGIYIYIYLQGVYEILGQISKVYSSCQNKEKSLYKRIIKYEWLRS